MHAEARFKRAGQCTVDKGMGCVTASQTGRARAGVRMHMDVGIMHTNKHRARPAIRCATDLQVAVGRIDPCAAGTVAPCVPPRARRARRWVHGRARVTCATSGRRSVCRCAAAAAARWAQQSVVVPTHPPPSHNHLSTLPQMTLPSAPTQPTHADRRLLLWHPTCPEPRPNQGPAGLVRERGRGAGPRARARSAEVLTGGGRTPREQRKVLLQQCGLRLASLVVGVRVPARKEGAEAPAPARAARNNNTICCMHVCVRPSCPSHFHTAAAAGRRLWGTRLGC